jgi:hypothetical protein
VEQVSEVKMSGFFAKKKMRVKAQGSTGPVDLSLGVVGGMFEIPKNVDDGKGHRAALRPDEGPAELSCCFLAPSARETTARQRQVGATWPSEPVETYASET